LRHCHGPGYPCLEDARDARLAFIRRRPHDGDREYLLELFDELAALPGQLRASH
jgi:hypothetical protein